MRNPLAKLVVLFTVLGCGGGNELPPRDPPGSGGSGGAGAGTGGSPGFGGTGGGFGGSGGGTGGSGGATGGSGGGATGGTGGGATGGTGGGTGGSGGGTGGSGGRDAGTTADMRAGGGGSGGTGGMTADAGTPPSSDASIPPPASGQGPVAPGRIVYSQDFENGMEGISRSPNGLPMDRAVIVDDPQNMRGKVMKVEWRAGDNFRTSGGTEPRSWISNRPGNEFTPGKKMSHAFGFMMSSANTDYAFGQIISSGGPVWMLIVEGSGTLTVFCNTCGGNTRHMQLQPNRWYDFRVDLDFSVGGPVVFYLNGQMFRMGRMTSTRGNIAHWDGGIYNRPAGTSANRTRTVYISNLSVGERQ